MDNKFNAKRIADPCNGCDRDRDETCKKYDKNCAAYMDYRSRKMLEEMEKGEL